MTPDVLTVRDAELPGAVNPARLVAVRTPLWDDLGGADHPGRRPDKLARAGFAPHVGVLNPLGRVARPRRRPTRRVVPARLTPPDWCERERFDLVGVR